MTRASVTRDVKPPAVSLREPAQPQAVRGICLWGIVPDSNGGQALRRNRRAKICLETGVLRS
jgi:hypothetical protein